MTNFRMALEKLIKVPESQIAFASSQFPSDSSQFPSDSIMNMIAILPLMYPGDIV